jgi:molybdate transport system substrate-binding protein
MRVLLLSLTLLCGGFCGGFCDETAAEPLRVAVAANFRPTLETIGEAYAAETGTALRISSAATGVLYSQALFGAPFDLLLAADSLRPRRLVEGGHALADSLTTYAYGRLVLAFPERLASPEQPDITALLATPGITLAIANPELAPYGRAARAVLARAPLHERSRLLTASNVGQAFQMWHSGGADLALVAASYRPRPHLEVPADWYPPIAQQAVILNTAGEPGRARHFLAFLTGEDSRSIIAADGYTVPPDIPAHE